jgi:hypothetical protein
MGGVPDRPREAAGDALEIGKYTIASLVLEAHESALEILVI